MFHLLLFFTFIIGAMAGVYIDGPCPDVKPVKNFKLSMITGRWHEVARYQNNFENGTCIVADIQKDSDNYTIEINDFSSENPKKVKGYFEYAPNAHGTGAIIARSSLVSELEGVTDLPLNIVDIDCDSYFIAYECKYNEAKKKNHVYVFVDTRDPMLSPDVKAKVDKFIKSSGYIDDHQFVWDHFEPESCGMKI